MIEATELTKKQKTRERILGSASRLLRERGIAGASVNDIMLGAGLTVGGFYAHFRSKEKLVGETFKWTLEHAAGGLLKGLTLVSAADRLDEFLGRYLSETHRDSTQEGCPIAALVADFGDGSSELRRIFAEQCERLIFERRRFFSDDEFRLTREDWLAIMSTYVGGLLLARATRGTSLSKEFLAASRSFVRRSIG